MDAFYRSTIGFYKNNLENGMKSFETMNTCMCLLMFGKLVDDYWKSIIVKVDVLFRI